MSGFELTPAQRTVRDDARRVGEDLAPIAHAATPGRVNRPLVRALAEHGLLPRLFPQGGKLQAMDLCLMREGLAMSCTEAETALALQGLGAYPILHGARQEVAARWIPRVAAGDAIAAIAVSEPDAGSDAAAIALRAERSAGGWRLTGTKTWISNAPEADVYALFARTTEGAGARGVTAFLVEGGARGLSGTPLDLLAPHAVGTLVLDGVEVGDDAVLGAIDQGFQLAMRTLDLFRPSVGAFAVGMAQAALDASLAHAATRRQFGKELREHQAVAHALADMSVLVEASRLLVYRAAGAYDAAGRADTRLSATAKLFATESAQRVIDSAIQIHGARGLVRGSLLETLYREVRATRIYEGTSEIQRTIIARELYR